MGNIPARKRLYLTPPTDPSKRTTKSKVPTESSEQKLLVAWRDFWTDKYPVLYLLHSIPNGGFRSKRTALTMRLEGVVKGIPDLFLPVPISPHHGLYVEMKRTQGGRLSDEQKKIIPMLQGLGYKVVVCKGFEEAKKEICDYLSLPHEVLVWGR